VLFYLVYHLCNLEPSLLSIPPPFLQAYCRAVFSKQLHAALRAVSALQLHLQGAPVSVPFFQHVNLRPSSVELHYRADRVNVAALRDGQLHELVNLVPWEGVVLDVKGIRLAGLQVRQGGFAYTTVNIF
jgi:hypothetical protein